MQENHDDESIGDADEAERLESQPPAEVVRLARHQRAAAGEHLPRVNPAHVQPRRHGTRASAVIIGNQRERRGNVKRFGNAHRRAREKQLLVSLRLPRQPRDDRPDDQRTQDDELAAEAVGQIPADGAERRVNDEKRRRHRAELPLRHRNAVLAAARDRRVEHREQLAVEIIQHDDDPEHADGDPRPFARRRFRRRRGQRLIAEAFLQSEKNRRDRDGESRPRREVDVGGCAVEQRFSQFHEAVGLFLHKKSKGRKVFHFVLILSF